MKCVALKLGFNKGGRNIQEKKKGYFVSIPTAQLECAPTTNSPTWRRRKNEK
jgi:hypothetical protein